MKKKSLSKTATKKKTHVTKTKKKMSTSEKGKKKQAEVTIPLLEMLDLPSLLYCAQCGKEIVLDENILQEKVLVCCGQMMTRKD